MAQNYSSLMAAFRFLSSSIVQNDFQWIFCSTYLKCSLVHYLQSYECCENSIDFLQSTCSHIIIRTTFISSFLHIQSKVFDACFGDAYCALANAQIIHHPHTSLRMILCLFGQGCDISYVIMSLASVAYRQVQGIVETWTKKYQYHISLMESKPNQVKFMVEFSLPQPQKPVPVATIRVYFTCLNQEHLKMTFRFEKDSLIHTPTKTIRHQEIEKWIDDSLAKKLLVRQTVFYLGTAYESTRVHDPRQDAILKQPIKQEEVEYVWIHPDLLADQRRLIDVIETERVQKQTVQSELKRFWKQVDKEGIGVITQPEFLQLVKNIGVRLSPTEEKEVLKRVDPQESGLVEYSFYVAVVGELVEGIEAKKAAAARLATHDEEEIFGSVLMLVGDEAQDIEEAMLQRFRVKDEDETGVSNISEVKAVLDEIIKKGKQQGKPQPLTVVEVAEVTRILTDTYGYKDIPYAKIHGHIIAYKIQQLTAGRINSRMNNLEVHLRQLFDKHDDKKVGKVKIEHFEQALQKSQKIKLTRAQIYLLKSFLVVDVKGEVNYVDNSKFLAELIKKFYLNSGKRKE